MKYVLDTNIIKRFGGGNASKNIQKWHKTVNDNEVYITALSVQEINKGIELLRKTGDPQKLKAAAELKKNLMI